MIIGKDFYRVFVENAKIKNKVYFQKTRKGKGDSLRYSFYADRYDYLRIAKAIMNDWNNNTCVGKYLQTVYDRRIPKNEDDLFACKTCDVNNNTRSYGGQFHFDVVGMEDRKIIGMSGFAGQNIVIDIDNEKKILVKGMYFPSNCDIMVP